MSSEISNYKEAQTCHAEMSEILMKAEHRGCVGFYYDAHVAVKFRFIIKEGDYERPQYTERLARCLGIACALQEKALCQRALELSQIELDAQKQKAQDEAIAFLKQS